MFNLAHEDRLELLVAVAGALLGIAGALLGIVTGYVSGQEWFIIMLVWAVVGTVVVSEAVQVFR